MSQKRDSSYKKRKILKTAMVGCDPSLPNPDKGYRRQDEKREIEEALEELVEEYEA